MKKQAVGKQENVFLFESPLTEMTRFKFTTFCSLHVDLDYSHFGRLKFSSAHVKFDINLASPKMVCN